MNRIITTLLALLLIQLLVVKKTFGNETEVKDCFEKLNRATFALNMGLDKVIFKPIAKGYRKVCCASITCVVGKRSCCISSHD